MAASFLQASGPLHTPGLGSRLGLSVAILLLLGLSSAAVYDWHVNSSWLPCDFFFATVGGMKLRPHYLHSSGMLRVSYYISNSISAFANSKFIMLPFPAMSTILLLLSGLNPNPGPPIAAADLPVGTFKSPLFCSVNLCGLLSKLDDIRCLATSQRPQVMALQESHLSVRVKTDEVNLPGYQFFRCDRKGAGKGGVGLYVANSLHPTSLYSAHLLPRVSELVAVRASFATRTVTFASIYLSPKNRYSADDFDSWLDSLTNWLATLAEDVSNVVLMGDLNLAPGEQNYKRLLRVFNSFGLRQIVNEPTHGGGSMALRQIDHIFVGCPLLGGKCLLAPPIEKQASGHSLILFSPISVRSVSNSTAKVPVRLFRDTDLPRAEFLLSYTSTGEQRDLSSEVLACTGPDEAATFLMQEISSTYMTCTPVSKVTSGFRAVPPVDRDVLKLIRKRNHLYQQSWRQGDFSKRAQLNRLRNQIRFRLRNTRTSWAHSILQSAAPNAKGFWSAIRKISGFIRPNIPTLIQGDVIAATDQRKADLLAAELQNNFSRNQFPLPAVANAVGPPDGLVLKSDVEKCISKLHNSAPGSDGIPPAFIKAMKALLSGPIAALLQKCLQYGEFPSDFKIAQIAPIPKVVGSSNPADYRPISVTSAVSKVMEYWLLSKIRHLIIPSDYQFGFRKHCGTDDAILNLQHQVALGLDSCSRAAHVVVVSLDIFRAFDQVNHNLLVGLLQEKLISPLFLRVIVSFFSNRFQFVKVNTAHSVKYPVLSGVCQGTVLGPYLFNVVVDRIFQSAQLSPGSHISMYADDLVYVKALQDSNSMSEAQSDIDILNTCYNDIGLSVNSKKSQLLLVSAARRDRPQICLKVAGSEIQCVPLLKYLGVYIDEGFTFSTHIQHSTINAKKELGALHRRLGKFVSASSFLRVYRQVILPQFTYSLPVIAPHYKRDWLLLEGIQKFALRLASNNYKKSYSSLLQEFDMFPIVRLYFELAARSVYKLVYKLRHSPSDLFNNFAISQNRHYSLRSRTTNTYNPLMEWKFQRSRPLEICLSMPIYRLIHIWNMLSDEIVSYGFSQFSAKLANSDTVFDRFCSAFATFCVYMS